MLVVSALWLASCGGGGGGDGGGDGGGGAGGGGGGGGGGGASTVMVAVAVLEPPGPLALMVYVVESLGNTRRLPFACTVPMP